MNYLVMTCKVILIPPKILSNKFDHILLYICELPSIFNIFTHLIPGDFSGF